MTYRFQLQSSEQLPGESEGLIRFLFCNGEYDEDTLFNVKLVVYELAGNVLRHDHCRAEVEVSLCPDSIVVDVKGASPFSLEPFLADTSAEKGRGLYLVQSITSSLARSDDGEIRAVLARKM